MVCLFRRSALARVPSRTTLVLVAIIVTISVNAGHRTLAQLESAPRLAEPPRADATRLIPLYYTRNVDEVIALVQGRMVLPPRNAQQDAVSTSVSEQVRVASVGEAKLHLRGSQDGVNAVARMIHEIDQPVGQVKIAIHVLQLSGSDDAAIEDMHTIINRHLQHARFMSRESQQLFRSSLSTVANQVYQNSPQRFAEAFFHESCLRNFRALNGGDNGPLSIEALDSRDIVNSIFLACIAKQEVRRAIVLEFQRMVATQLPRHYERYRAAIVAKHAPTTAPARFHVPGFGSDKSRRTTMPSMHEPDFSFSRLTAFLNSLDGPHTTTNSIQVALLRYQRAHLELRTTQAIVARMRDNRLLLSHSQNATQGQTVTHPVSGQTMDIRAFTQLADRITSERESRITDQREILRAEVATLDGHLKTMSEAFEEDVRRQFYQPALEDLRQASRAWKVHMGQVQTTTIVTNDRTRARVSPEQLVVLERPKRDILLQEGLQVANGLAQETRVVGQAAAAAGASDAMVPGSSLLLAAAGITPTPGKHLESLKTPSSRLAISVGDEVDVTPVIQPDGASVAFHLLYTHTPRVEQDDDATSSLGRVRRHLVEAEVHAQSHELKVVSRFRVELGEEQQERGVKLLEDLPIIGVLFRPQRSRAVTSQENIILADVVVYPTAYSLGDASLAVDSNRGNHPVNAHRLDSPYRTPVGLAEWVEQTLQDHAERTLTGRSQTMIALPPVRPASPTDGSPLRR